ncbi:hypothetical protein PLEOSDRAFT_154034 [Pleurotus ostreatus PC15]|uniref:ATP-dependent RNA helicase n=1 Tax=Pleurotus ostreatus (strain PC15) TaxID=1137138 RepID=A0A067P616_PLEO1|nr:hypothetical protein PLEOSDRAFT_154034 [Pleurotus ostreatus PC15]
MPSKTPTEVKRKPTAFASILKARKKRKLSHTRATTYSTPDSLPWRTASRPLESGFDGDDGILGLEEVEGVEVVYEETADGGRVARFNVFNEPEEIDEAGIEEDATSRSDAKLPTQEPTPEPVCEEQPDIPEEIVELPEWSNVELHPSLLRFLHARHFVSPTPIQAAAIPFAISGRDVIGVAETGSGKTLAYGLPILHSIITEKLNARKLETSSRRTLRALVLAPTRELALQVSSHLSACTNPLCDESGKADGPSKVSKSPPLVSIAAIVGGMSAQKQRRILDRGLDILVATPGRLWDIIQEDESLAQEIKAIRFLVLDEADRMIEHGHFAELDNILRLTLRETQEDQIDAQFNDDPEAAAENEDNQHGARTDGMQTFVFSATLSKDLQRNLKKRQKHFKNSSRRKKQEPASTLDDLLMRLDFRDSNPEVIDLSPEGGVVSTLRESKIECLASDKDVYLYYFLLRYPGRSLVFLSSIDGIRRLMPLLETLEIKALALHSQMEQRARLKNLDRFKTTPNAVLLATDIAARGLDIPAVDHVIHFQIPRTADTYVHRNGRTARAKMEGVSLLLCAPEERKVVRALLGSLNRDESSIPELTLELTILDKLKARVQLAKKIESAHHKATKENHDRKWLKETADAMEIELDEDMFDSDAEDQRTQNSKRARKVQHAKIVGLKSELKRMLAQPLLATGVSARYIMSGSRPIVDDLLAGESNAALVGLKNIAAGRDIDTAVARKASRKGTKGDSKRKEAEYEEWAGVSVD